MKGRLTLYHIIPTLTTLGKEAFENTLGNGENPGNAGNQHFLHFPPYFQPFKTQILIFGLCRLQMLSSWTSLKFYRLLKS